MTTGAKESHPCAGCKWLEWEYITPIDRAERAIPVCHIIGYSVTVARCDAYEKES